MLDNGNWTEWSAIWAEITRDFKIERARSTSLIWNHKYDFLYYYPHFEITGGPCNLIGSS